MSFPLPEITNLHQGPANASVVHVPPGGTAILGHGTAARIGPPSAPRSPPLLIARVDRPWAATCVTGNQVDLELGFTLASGGLNENVSMSVRAFGNSTGGGGKELTIGSERTAAGGVIGRLDSNAFAITRGACTRVHTDAAPTVVALPSDTLDSMRCCRDHRGEEHRVAVAH